ncbi:MAG: hypothetical protein JWN02_1265, partial [Acidobacteria bacterium]|nr:hypothetical protein [Acidobacteriota bacterium]
MLRHLTFAGTALLLFAHGLAARAGVQVRVNVGGAAACADAQVTLQAHACKGPVCDGEVRSLTLPLGQDRLFPLDDSRRWRIELVAPAGCWAAPLFVDAPPLLPAVKLAAWPSGLLTGSVRSGSGDPLPATLRVQMTLPGGAEPVTIDCLVIGADLRCKAPAARLDLRLAAPHFVPRYLWGVEVPIDGTRDLGETVLRGGASIAGWVSIDARRASAAGVAVKLLAQSVGETPLAAVKTNERGFFQFTGVAEGSYVLRAEERGRSPAIRDGVRITSDEEVILSQPLLLKTLARIDVTLAPAVDPDGAPWHLSLGGRIPMSHLMRKAAEGTATPGGSWAHDGLENGDYELRVTNGHGDVFHRQELRIDSDFLPVSVLVPVVPVRGRLRVGDKGLAAAIHWLGDDGTGATFVSDDDGSFQGYLSREGSWRADIRPRASKQ